MTAWHETLRSVAFESLRVLSGDQLKGGSCRQASTESKACIGALEDCLENRWRLAAAAEDLKGLEQSLQTCRLTSQEAGFKFWLIGFSLWLLGICWGFLFGIFAREFWARKKKDPKVVRGSPVPLPFVEATSGRFKSYRSGGSRISLRARSILITFIIFGNSSCIILAVVRSTLVLLSFHLHSLFFRSYLVSLQYFDDFYHIRQ